MYDSRLRLGNQIYEELKKHFRELVFDTVIQRNIRLSERPATAYRRSCTIPNSKGALNHLQLAKELIKREKKSK